MSTVAFTFGNFNPPTKSHQLVLDKLKSVAKAKGIEYHILLCSVSDNNTNPLEYYDKLNFMKQMFPDTFDDYEPPDVYIAGMVQACVYLYEKGYKNIVCVCGENKRYRVDFILNSYNRVKSKWGFYDFGSIKVVTSANGESSSNKMLESVRKNDYSSFKQHLPQNFDGRVLYERIKKKALN